MNVLGAAESRLVERIAERTVPIVRRLPTSQRIVRAPQHAAQWLHEAARYLAGCMPGGENGRAYIVVVKDLRWSEFLVDDARCREVDAAMCIATGDHEPRKANVAPIDHNPERCADWLREWADRLADCMPAGRGVVATVRPGHAYTYIVTKREAELVEQSMSAAAGDLERRG